MYLFIIFRLTFNFLVAIIQEYIRGSFPNKKMKGFV